MLPQAKTKSSGRDKSRLILVKKERKKEKNPLKFVSKHHFNPFSLMVTKLKI